MHVLYYIMVLLVMLNWNWNNFYKPLKILTTFNNCVRNKI